MSDLVSMVCKLRRPRLLIRAARAGQGGLQTANADLKRVMRVSGRAGPGPRIAFASGGGGENGSDAPLGRCELQFHPPHRASDRDDRRGADPARRRPGITKKRAARASGPLIVTPTGVCRHMNASGIEAFFFATLFVQRLFDRRIDRRLLVVVEKLRDPLARERDGITGTLFLPGLEGACSQEAGCARMPA